MSSPAEPPKLRGPQLGLQSWTCREMCFDDMVDFAVEQGIKRVALCDLHIDPSAPSNVNASKFRVMRDAGIDPYTMYAAMGRNDEEDGQVLAVAKLAEMEFLVVEPCDQSKWPQLLAAAKRHDLSLAVHNHSRETAYGDPAMVHALLERYPDLRVCLDIGWVTMAGFDAAEVFRSYGDRVIDLHFKDKAAQLGSDGVRTWADRVPGEGDANFAGVFKAIRETGWSGTMAIETDSAGFAVNPREFVQRAINCFNALWNASGMPLGFDYTRDNGALPEQWPCGIDAQDRQDIEREWQALSRELTELRDLVSAASTADVEIYLNQMLWALRFEARLSAAQIASVKESLEEGRQRAAALLRGEAPWRQSTGRVLRGHRSAIDGSAQIYGLVVPENYDGTSPVRLDVVLHGSIPPTDGSAQLRFSSWFRQFGMGWRASDADYMEVYPLGRVTNGYRYAGQSDIFEAIEAVKREYNVDPDRIMLRGFSMGASGTWHVGLKNPDQFAALGPYMGYVDTRFFSKREGNGRLIKVGALPAHEERVLPTMDAVSYAANAGLMPVVAAMGERDPGVSNHAFMGLAMLKENLQMINLVAPGAGHRVALVTHRKQVELMDRLAGEGVDRMRSEVRFVTYSLRYNRAYWVELLGLGQHDARAEILVRATAPDEVTVSRLRNITAFALNADRFDSSNPRVVFPCQTIMLNRNLLHPEHGWVLAETQQGWAQVADLPAVESGAWRKRPGQQGSIDDAFTMPFLAVRGTRTPWHPAVTAMAEAELLRFAYQWNRYWVGEVPVKADRDVTAEDTHTKNLIVFGDPGSNSVLADMLADLPLEWTKEAVTMNQQRYAASAHLPVMIHPNPLAGGSDRYVVLNSGYTFGEAASSSVAYLNYSRLGDWAIRSLDGTAPVAVGHFDESWSY